MSQLVCDALVLRTVAFGESDLVVHLLCRESGRVSAIAKGARRSKRRFPGTLDLFHRLRVQLDRRRRTGMARLEGAVLRTPHLGIRQDWRRFALAAWLCELLDRLAPEGGAGRDLRALFDFADAALELIESAEPDARLRLWIELRALDALGLRPELRSCVRCGKPIEGTGPMAFHVGEGGAVCGACGERAEGLVRIHLGTLRALAQALDFELGQLGRLSLSPAALGEAEALLSRFQRFHVGVELRSRPLLEQATAEPPRADA